MLSCDSDSLIFMAARWVITFAFLSVGCIEQRPAIPTTATTTSGMKVCWLSSQEREALGVAVTTKYDNGSAALYDALERRLQGAGYVLVQAGCDLSLGWHFQRLVPVSSLGDEVGTMIVRDNHNRLLDTFRVEFFRYDVPLHDPDRLAIWWVNAINSSPAVAQFATQRRLPTPKTATVNTP
jgi:hypothetical protein